jgi:chloramphenicol O-acetyltransferase type A
MKIIDTATWPRKSQYEFFKHIAAPHFSITSTVNVTALVNHRKSEEISLFNAFLYCIMTAANAVPELRMRFRGTTVIEHEVVHASATVPIENDRFAFCSIEYVPNWTVFNRGCVEALEKAQQQNELQEHIDDTDEWIFLSCLPWMRFTALTNPNSGPNDCIPRISWGKLDDGKGSTWTMPVSIQVHHALVDGIHVGKFYEALDDCLTNAPEFITQTSGTTTV